MYHQVDLNKEEMQDCVNFQKKCLELFAEIFHKYSDEKSFDIFSIGTGLLICSMMMTMRVDKTDLFIDDFCRLLKQLHPQVAKNSTSYMAFKNGKKVSEGKLN